MSYWFIYWFTRLDVLYILGVVTLILSISSIVSLFFLAGADEIDFNKAYTYIKRYSLLSLILGIFIVIFVPTTKEAAAIYLIPKIANNEEVSKIPDNALKLLNKRLEEWIDAIQ
jgi:hypothetical protein